MPAAFANLLKLHTDVPPADEPMLEDDRVFRIDCELVYEVSGPSEFVFLVHAMDTATQSIAYESFTLRPEIEHHFYECPAHGHRFVRAHADQGLLTLNYRAMVRKPPPIDDTQAEEHPIRDLPDELLHNLVSTRYCESDHLGRAAQGLFGDLPTGYARVQAIADWIHENITYLPGSTDAMTTARDVFVQRTGVCRDFAHLGVAFCRALNIPARFAVGYARFEEPPADFHAVFEAWLGGRWVMFDATRLSPVQDLVRIASGRDAKDVAFATIYGPARMVSMNPRIDVVGNVTLA